MDERGTILLIDDDAAFCENVARFITDRGQACQGLSNPQLILAQDLSRVALVLLDIDMPGLDGLTLLPLLKARQDIPVIMVSGISDLDARLAALKAGADFFFTKPVALDELFLVCVRRLMQKPPALQMAPAPWSLHVRTRQLTSPQGTSIGLTMTECRLLESLFASAPAEIGRLALIEIMTGERTEDSRSLRSLEVILSRLRTRFRHGGETLPIKAERNVGYVFLGTARILD